MATCTKLYSGKLGVGKLGKQRVTTRTSKHHYLSLQRPPHFYFLRYSKRPRALDLVMTGAIRDNRTQPLSSSAMLWGHLLHNTHQNHSRQVSSSRTGSSPTKTTLVHNVKAPVIPTDKTGTSARILLHDTKAHIEKFTDSVHGLVKGVDIAKNKMESLSQLFERSHEHVIEEAATLGMFFAAYMRTLSL